MRRTSLTGLTALLALAAAACDRGAGAAAGPVVRDSAGVRIVENPASAADTPLPWRIDPAPSLEIGGEGDSAAALYRVVGAMRLSDGRIVVGNGGTGELRVFGADGALLRSVGGEGDGPGQYRALFWIGPYAGDSVAAWDAALGRLTVVSPEGGAARVVTPARPLGMFPQARGVLSDGTALVASPAPPGAALPAGGGVQRDTAEYLLVGPGGEVRSTLGRFPESERFVMTAPGVPFAAQTLPFGRQTVAAVSGDVAYLGTGDRYEIAAVEPGRGVRRIVRLDRPRRRVTAEDERAYREGLIVLGAGGDPAIARAQREMLERLPFPREMPAYTALLVDPDGDLWVEEPGRPGDPEGMRWTVFAPDGTARGWLRTPPGLQVKQVGRDWILGVSVGPDAVERVRLHRVAR